MKQNKLNTLLLIILIILFSLVLLKLNKKNELNVITSIPSETKENKPDQTDSEYVHSLLDRNTIDNDSSKSWKTETIPGLSKRQVHFPPGWKLSSEITENRPGSGTYTMYCITETDCNSIDAIYVGIPYTGANSPYVIYMIMPDGDENYSISWDASQKAKDVFRAIVTVQLQGL